MSNWHLIETAPKDGTPILAWTKHDDWGDGRRVLWWGEHPTVIWVTSWTDGHHHSYRPTHWQPLPEPPSN